MLSQASATDPTSATQTIQQARQLIDLIVSDDPRPVIVLDDTDRWLSTSYQPDNPTVRGAFFGRVVRILAEDLGTAAIVAVHPSYLDDPACQASRGFLDTTIHIPTLPDRGLVTQVLAHRGNLVLGSSATVDEFLEDAASEVLYSHYATAPNVRKNASARRRRSPDPRRRRPGGHPHPNPLHRRHHANRRPDLDRPGFRCGTPM